MASSTAAAPHALRAQVYFPRVADFERREDGSPIRESLRGPAIIEARQQIARERIVHGAELKILQEKLRTCYHESGVNQCVWTAGPAGAAGRRRTRRLRAAGTAAGAAALRARARAARAAALRAMRSRVGAGLMRRSRRARGSSARLLKPLARAGAGFLLTPPARLLPLPSRSYEDCAEIAKAYIAQLKGSTCRLKGLPK